MRDGDTRMNLIGIEEHYLTTEVRDAWDAIGLAATDPSVAIHAGEIERRLLDRRGADRSHGRNRPRCSGLVLDHACLARSDRQVGRTQRQRGPIYCASYRHVWVEKDAVELILDRYSSHRRAVVCGAEHHERHGQQVDGRDRQPDRTRPLSLHHEVEVGEAKRRDDRS